ncbi:MAG: germination protein YpeB [Clostridiales bacterium]|nr:germination protein YpeB [Clostridiales bacterium]
MNKKIIATLAIFIALLSGVLVYEYRDIKKLRGELNNNYNRAFYDMMGYVDNIKTIMTKAVVFKTCPKSSNFLEEIWHKANMAQENLNMIPIEEATLKKTSKYLNQVGDFAYSLNKQSLNKKDLTQDQQKTLQKLKTYSEVLMHSLKEMEQDINDGKFRWSNLRRLNKNVPAVDYLGDIQKNFQDYPTLIYDGPFSDHVDNIKPKGLVGKKISKDRARDVVKKFLGDKAKDIKYVGTTKGWVETYNFELHSPNDEITYVDVTKVGGKIYSMISNRSIRKAKLNIDEAKEKAETFLKKRGYKDMVDTYYINEDNVATINYAFKKDDVICYPDLIKVKVALDTGDVVGFEAGGYIASHMDRNIKESKIKLEEAREKINEDVKILNSKRAIIPTELKTEVLTYEFLGKLGENDFLVYINTETGEVENVLMIIDTPNGVLTM